MHRNHLSVPALFALATATALGACTHKLNTSQRDLIAPEPQVQVRGNPALGQVGGSIADVAERALPSVVNISLTKVARTAHPFFFPFGEPPDTERQVHGMGSGVIISADGYVLTNNHVVQGAKEIRVTMFDKREFEATVIGTDPKTDLAVLKLKNTPSGLKPIEFGDSSRLRLGDVVLAIGNPMGIGLTVTMGIVSAKGRAEMGVVDYEDFIQTDAAINPGNSGGALISMEGKLVGISTLILSRSGGSEGLGFAIPSNMAAPIWESLRQTGKVTRSWLGVGIQEIDQDIAQALKVAPHSGLLISSVQEGSPAARAGLRRGDIITKVDGRPADSRSNFRNLIAGFGARKRVELQVMRDNRAQTISAELGELPNSDAVGNLNPDSSAQGGALDGIALQGLSTENRQAFQIPSEIKQGVVISRVEPRSTAARAGLRPGDVILEVNRAPVDSVQRFQEEYSKSKNNALLLVQRKRESLYVVVRAN